MSDEEYEIGVGVDATQAINQLQKVESATNKLKATADKATPSLIKQSQALDKVAASAQKMSKAQAAAAKTVTGFKGQSTTQGQLDLYNKILPAQTRYAAEVKKLGGVYGQDTRAIQSNVLAQKAQVASLRAAQTAQNKYYQSLSNTRYALYDASQAYLGLATGLMAPAAAAIAFSTQYDKAFSSVRRTTLETGAPLQQLRDDLVQLTTEMPTSFEAVANIATIGAQLNVAAADLGNFTKVVAMFSATTNTSVDAAAVGLGRLAQLTHTAGSDYEALGSAIYRVGITSVATEQEILDMASEIATSGDLAGFTNHQIIALAGSLSSLGVQPEAARGSLMRIFNVIETGAASGGAALEKLADVSGMSSATLQKTWGTDSQRVFTAFVRGLGKMQDAGGNTNAVLKSMGVTAIRDIRTLQILANNTDIYANALQESNEAYNSGSALREGYALQMQNLADKMQMLFNTLKAVADAIGGEFAPVLIDMAESAKALADGFLWLSKTPVGGVLAALTVAVMAGAGAMFAINAIVMIVKASLAALTTSMIGLRDNAGILSGGLKGLALSFYDVSRGIIATDVAARRSTGGFSGMANGAYQAKRAVEGVTAGTRGASTALVGFKSLLATTGIGLALVALPAIVDAISNSLKSGADKARDYFGTFDSLDAAIKADTEAWKAAVAAGDSAANSFRLVNGTVEESITVTGTFAKEMKAAAEGQDTWGSKVDETTKKITDQTVALGAATKAAFANELANGGSEDGGDSVAKIWAKNKEAFKEMGVSASAYLNAAIANTGDAYLAQYKVQVRQQLLALEASTLGTDQGATQAETEQINKYREQLKALDLLAGAAQVLGEKAQEAADKQGFLGDAGLAAKSKLDQEASSLDSLTSKMTDIVNANTSMLDSTLGVEGAFSDLATSIASNGSSFDAYSAAGQANLSALKGAVSDLATASGDDTAAFSANLMGMIATLQSSGNAISGDLSFLLDILQQTFGAQWGVDVSTDAARQNINVYIAKVIEAINVTRQLAQSDADMALSLGNWSAYNDAMIKVNAANKSLAQVENIQSAATKAAAKGVKNLSDAHKKQAGSADKASKANNNNAKSAKKAARTYADWADDLKKVIDRANEFRWSASDAFAEIEKANKNVVREMVESMYDLEGAYTRVFSGREFSDAFSSMFNDLRDSAEDAADAVTSAKNSILSAQAELSGLASDTSNLQYALGVANTYGDTLRAQEIQAELAKVESDRADTETRLATATRDLQRAQDSQNKSLTDGSDQAIENRATVRKLLGTYTDYLDNLVESGATADDLNNVIAQSKTDFVNQGKALGFSSDEMQQYTSLFDKFASTGGTTSAEMTDAVRDLYDAWEDYIVQLANSGATQATINKAISDGKTAVSNLGAQMGLSKTAIDEYKGAFDGLKTILDKIPKNVSVTFAADTSAAQKAIEEFKTTLDKAATAAGTLDSKLDKISGSGGTINTPTLDDKKLRKLELQAERLLYLQYAAGYAGKGQTSNYDHWIKKAAAIESKINSGNYSSGGFTGQGGKYEPAGIVHKGEYVIPKSMVNQNTGLPYADALGRVMRGYAGGGYVTAPQRATNASASIVELSPTDRALLAAAGNVTITVDGKVLASSVNRANRNGNIRGAG